MHLTIPQLVEQLKDSLESRKLDHPLATAEACAFLEACGYPGLKLLGEGLGDETRDLPLIRDALGLDLKNVSCVFIAPKLADYIGQNGRVFLRNVRHGLYLLPDSVTLNYAIGCPVDPSFALGGDRTKNPYAEKLEAALSDGLTIDDSLLSAITSPN